MGRPAEGANDEKFGKIKTSTWLGPGLSVLAGGLQGTHRHRREFERLERESVAISPMGMEDQLLLLYIASTMRPPDQFGTTAQPPALLFGDDRWENSNQSCCKQPVVHVTREYEEIHQESRNQPRGSRTHLRGMFRDKHPDRQ